MDQSKEFRDIAEPLPRQDLSSPTFNKFGEEDIDGDSGEISGGGDWNYPHSTDEENGFDYNEESVTEAHKLLDESRTSQSVVAPVSSVMNTKAEHLRAKKKVSERWVRQAKIMTITNVWAYVLLYPILQLLLRQNKRLTIRKN